MNIGIGTTFNFDIPLEEMIPMIKQAGFSFISLAGGNVEQSGYLTAEGRRKILRICQRNGVVVESIHAPLDRTIDISSLDKRTRDYSVHLFKQAIHACNEFGCAKLILHLNNRFASDELSNRIVTVRESLADLVPYATRKNVFLAFENLVRPHALELLEHMLAEFNNVAVGMCLDTSHAHLSNRLCDLLDKHQNRIIAVHISDNKGQLDDHSLPFEGSIDWSRFTEHFAHINYTGIFLLEVEVRESSFKDPNVFLEQAYIRATKLVSLIDEYRLGNESGR